MKTCRALSLVCFLLVASFSVSWGQSATPTRGVSVLDDTLVLQHDRGRVTLVWTGWIAFAKTTEDPVTVSVSYDLTPAGPWNAQGSRVASEASGRHVGSASVYERIPIATLESSGPASPAALFTKEQVVNLRISVRPVYALSPGASLAETSYMLKPLNYLLLSAACRGQVDTATELLDAGAAVNSANLENKTALMMAALHGRLAMAKLLVERGASINMRTKGSPFIISPLGSARPGGWTALAAAASGGNAAIVDLLLERGAAVNAWADDQMSPLKAAVDRGNPKIVGTLLSRGAAVNALDDAGFSPLAMADINGRAAVARVLRKHGGRIIVPWDPLSGGH